MCFVLFCCSDTIVAEKKKERPTCRVKSNARCSGRGGEREEPVEEQLDDRDRDCHQGCGDDH